MSKTKQLEQEYFAANRESWKAKETLRKAELAYRKANEERDKAYTAFELARNSAETEQT